MTAQTRSWPARALLGVANVVVSAFVIADEIARPVYRPAFDAINRLAFMRRMEAAVATLPRYGILAVLAVPFLGVEPLKIVGVYWMGTGHFLGGLATLVVAYLASFVLVERIYHAGRDKLLTIGWFAACIGFAASVRDRLLESVRATRAWTVAVGVAASAKAFARRVMDRAGGRRQAV